MMFEGQVWGIKMRMVLSLDFSVLILITRRNPNVSLTLSSRAPRGARRTPFFFFLWRTNANESPAGRTFCRHLCLWRRHRGWHTKLRGNSIFEAIQIGKVDFIWSYLVFPNCLKFGLVWFGGYMLPSIEFSWSTFLINCAFHSHIIGIFHLQGGMATYGWRMIGEEWREESGKNCAAASALLLLMGVRKKKRSLLSFMAAAKAASVVAAALLT